MNMAYYAVYRSASEVSEVPNGLFRRGSDTAGNITLTESYHPDYGWSHTSYWVRIERDEFEKHLVEVDEDRADVIRAYFDAKYAGPDRPQSRPRPPSRLRRAVLALRREPPRP